MKKITRRNFLVAMGLAAGSALLTACGETASSGAVTSGSAAASGASTADGDQGEIRVVTFFAGSDQWAPVWKEVVADYMTDNPGVTIIDESQPTSGAQDLFRTKVQSDVAAQTPPDLMLYYNGADASVALDSELFIDLRPVMEADSAWSANLKPGAMEAGQLEDGTQYCIPYIGYFEGLLYNKNLFDKYNLAEPTTWENIEACISVFNENGIVPFATSLMKPSYMMELLLLGQVGAEGQKDYFSESWIPAVQIVKDLYDEGAFPADCMTMTEDDIRVLFADEKAAMMVNGSWTVSGLKDNDGFRMISMPTLPGGVGGSDVALSGFGSGWYMSKAAAERDDVALHFLKYLTSPETMTRFIAMGGSPAITCDAPEGATPLEVSCMEMLNTATKFVTACDSQVTRESWLTLTEPGLQYIAIGETTAEDLLKQCKALNEAG